MRDEAARLGLATAERDDDPPFLEERAILVTTFQKLINGQSRFGVVGGRHTPMRGIDLARRAVSSCPRPRASLNPVNATRST